VREEKLSVIPLILFGSPGLMPQGFRKIWQEYEVEADRAAAERVAAAGYDLDSAPTAEFLAMQDRVRERPPAPRRAPSLRRAGER
jgi:predicted Zn-dependent protease